MFTGFCLGSNDIARSKAFYDKLLGTLGIGCLDEGPTWLGYGKPGGQMLWILKPRDGRPATWGNGTQVGFAAGSPAEVDAFHAAALSLGGIDEGAPGPRDYTPGAYGAYCRDPDGNKLHAAHLPGGYGL